MWYNVLRVLEFVILYGVPLFESLDALKKESDSSKIKKWAVFWAVQFVLGIVGRPFSFLHRYA